MGETNRDFFSPSRSHFRFTENGHVNGLRESLSPLPKTSRHCVGTFPSEHSRSKKAFTMSLGMTMLLCFVGVFIFIGTLGRRSPVHSLNLIPTLGSHRPYRRVQADIVLNPFGGGIFGRGSIRLKELEACHDSEDYASCYNSSLSFWALSKSDQQCRLPEKVKPCLIQPPENYHIPPRWPISRDLVWHSNMKFLGDRQPRLHGTNSVRLVLEDNGQVHIRDKESDRDEIRTILQKVTRLINFSSRRNKLKILDIGCWLSQVGNPLLEHSWTLCVGPYEHNGSRVQFALERGLPAVMASIMNWQLPFSKSSFDIVFCSECGFDWTQRGGFFIFELDRLLKSGGYYMEASMSTMLSMVGDTDVERKKDLASKMCWSIVGKCDQAIVWKKTDNLTCYGSRDPKAVPKLCDSIQKQNNTLALLPCLIGSAHDLGVKKQQHLAAMERSFPGFSKQELLDDPHAWSMLVKSYWALLTPLIFSDHPKCPGEEDPSPPPNIVRNVMDMNAVHGSLNAALLAVGMSVWVMNVVPAARPNTLPIISDKGFIGILHDWCEPFPTYPRTYDLLHAIGLLSQEEGRLHGCVLSSLFLEMDRILRPEGWVILRDKAKLIEDARMAAVQMRWESRVVALEEGPDGLQLLVCQKIFWRNYS